MTTVEELVGEGRRARRDDRPDDAHGHMTSAVERARAVAAEAGPSAHADLALALLGLGQIERDLGRLDTALALHREALALRRQMNDRLGVAHTVRHVGDILCELDRLDEAEPCYVEALSVYRQRGGHGEESAGGGRGVPVDYTSGPEAAIRGSYANAVRPFALLRERVGQLEEARELWIEARALYASIGLQTGVEEADAHLARLG